MGWRDFTDAVRNVATPILQPAPLQQVFQGGNATLGERLAPDFSGKATLSTPSQTDDPNDPNASGAPRPTALMGGQPGFTPDFSKVNPEAGARFGPGAAAYNAPGTTRFAQTGKRFGPGGWDALMRQRMLAQNLREPTPTPTI